MDKNLHLSSLIVQFLVETRVSLGLEGGVILEELFANQGVQELDYT
jgi:hypothetical protein